MQRTDDEVIEKSIILHRLYKTHANIGMKWNWSQLNYNLLLVLMFKKDGVLGTMYFNDFRHIFPTSVWFYDFWGHLEKSEFCFIIRAY